MIKMKCCDTFHCLSLKEEDYNVHFCTWQCHCKAVWMCCDSKHYDTRWRYWRHCFNIKFPLFLTSIMNCANVCETDALNVLKDSHCYTNVVLALRMSRYSPISLYCKGMIHKNILFLMHVMMGHELNNWV
jgi:hypothetical protein